MLALKFGSHYGEMSVFEFGIVRPAYGHNAYIDHGTVISKCGRPRFTQLTELLRTVLTVTDEEIDRIELALMGEVVLLFRSLR